MQNTLPELTFDKSFLSISLNSGMLWGALALVIVLTCIVSVILFYHWSAYGYSKISTALVGTIYSIGAIVLLGIISTGIISYMGTL